MWDLLHALAPVLGTLLGWAGRQFVERRTWSVIQAAAHEAATADGSPEAVRAAAEKALLQSQLDKLALAAARAAAQFQTPKNGTNH